MLKYSSEALPGVVKILEKFNDINLFVEDTTSENIYKVFFQKLLPNDIRIAKIFQCEGRLGVISAASERRYKRLKNSFFMIDGDLFLLCGEKYDIPSNVFKLDMYCVENGLVCLKSAEKFAYECEPNLSAEKLRSILKFEKWFSNNVRKLLDLFVWYAAAMHFGSQIKTTSINGISFLKNGTSEIDKSLVEGKVTQIKGALEVEHGKRAVSRVVRSIKKEIKNYDDLSSFISAKTYLIPLIGRHLRLNTSFSDERGLTMRLCHNSGADRLTSLKNALAHKLVNVGTNTSQPVTAQKAA